MWWEFIWVIWLLKSKTYQRNINIKIWEFANKKNRIVFYGQIKVLNGGLLKIIILIQKIYNNTFKKSNFLNLLYRNNYNYIYNDNELF